jgi:hypothetical protein
MAAGMTYTDYARLGCLSNLRVGTDINLYSAMHCPNCQHDISDFLENGEAAMHYIEWGGNINKKISRKPTKRVRDLPKIQEALKNGVKSDFRMLPGATLTIEDLKSMAEKDVTNFLVRSGWYQPEHFCLIREHDPELWTKLLESCVKFGVIQNLPLDDKTLSFIKEKVTPAMLERPRFIKKVKMYRAAGMISPEVCKDIIGTNPTKLLAEMVVLTSKSYIKAMFGEYSDKQKTDYFNIFVDEKSLCKWMVRIHDIRAVKVFKDIPEDYKLDEDLEWKNYPVFEVYIYIDHVHKLVKGGLISKMQDSELSQKQRDDFIENWKQSREILGIKLTDEPMKIGQMRKYILANLFSKVRKQIQSYHTEKSMEYSCRGKRI